MNDNEETSSPEADELAQARAETAEFKDKYFRALAEMENARKRLQKEKQETSQYAIQNIVCEFLIPIDHFENALGFTDNMSEEVKHWALGFEMILTQLKDVLAANGIQPIEAQGKYFDPHLHEAVENVETNDIPADIVVEVFTRGYRMGERTIRPARVKVAKSIKNEGEKI